MNQHHILHATIIIEQKTITVLTIVYIYILRQPISAISVVTTILV